jgi:tetrahydromethanopterin S-methyltransferase subunit B
MKKFKLLLAGLLIGLMTVPLVACEKKGPAEKAGEQLDQTVEDTKDALNPQGPAEEAGEQFDQAVEDTKDALDPQGPAEEAGEKFDEAMEPGQ